MAQSEAVSFDLVAVTVTHFPEARTLQADEEDDDSAQQSTAAMAYDPAYLLPFCIQVSLPEVTGAAL